MTSTATGGGGGCCRECHASLKDRYNYYLIGVLDDGNPETEWSNKKPDCNSSV